MKPVSFIKVTYTEAGKEISVVYQSMFSCASKYHISVGTIKKLASGGTSSTTKDLPSDIKFSFIPNPAYLAKTPDSWYCILCEKEFCPSSKTNHLQSKKHRTLMDKDLKENKNYREQLEEGEITIERNEQEYVIRRGTGVSQSATTSSSSIETKVVDELDTLATWLKNPLPKDHPCLSLPVPPPKKTQGWGDKLSEIIHSLPKPLPTTTTVIDEMEALKVPIPPIPPPKPELSFPTVPSILSIVDPIITTTVSPVVNVISGTLAPTVISPNTSVIVPSILPTPKQTNKPTQQSGCVDYTRL